MKNNDNINKYKFCIRCKYPVADHRLDIKSGRWIRIDPQSGRVLCSIPDNPDRYNWGIVNERMNKAIKMYLDKYQKKEDLYKN